MAYSNRRALARGLSPKNKWYLPKYAFREALNYAQQYQDYLDRLEELGNGSRAISYDSQPHGDSKGTALEDLAIRRAKISVRVDKIEQACREADAELYPWLLKAVTNDGIGYDYLYYYLEPPIPCSRNTFYERRHKFFYLLYQKIL